mmetsp:Transcript_4825/g.7064  ORF Transcript_4825/g.7064 Transcript_4825/m.7064 type:complete len:343 (-) Transcript_4825:105-1133(-)
MKFQFFLSFVLLESCAAFTSPNTRVINVRSNTSTSLNAIPTPEESAKALTEYMTKSHQEKLKALKTMEDQKNAEIKALKEKNGSVGSEIVQASNAPAPATGSVEEITKKLEAYQKFMANYIVDASEDKARAVKEAEIAVANKYKAKLDAFMLPPTAGSSSVEEPLNEAFKERNVKLSEAAKAGKSRWGDKEVAKAAGANINVPKQILAAIPPAAFSSEAVAAADHGLRADGGVGGLSLAERVAGGAGGAVAVNGAVAATAPISSFVARNQFITAAAKAGKQYRWGSEEEDKAIEFSSNPLPAAAPVVITPEVEAADHGLRSDGGVGGPSLAERVNLGAQIMQ